MGYKTYLAKRTELWKKTDTLNAFVNAGKDLNTKVEKIKKAHDALIETLAKLHTDVGKIDTHGVKEFDAYKKSLLAVCSGFGNLRPLPTKPLEAAVAAERKNVDKTYKEWIAKNTASFPKELKKGMVLVDKTINNIYELASDQKQGRNGGYFDVICLREGTTSTFPLGLTDLSPAKGMKYLRG